MEYIYEKVCLPKQIVKVFNYYGGVEKSINKILDLSSTGEFEIGNKPKLSMTKDCRHFKVKITNRDYIELKRHYATNSSKVSLRRLCEWFVSNEMYFDWIPEPIEIYGENSYDRHLTRALIELLKAISFCKTDDKHTLLEMSRKIGGMLR